MTTRDDIQYAIAWVLNEAKIANNAVDIIARMIKCELQIAAGIKMPDGRISPPLPDLSSSATVATSISAAYKTLGATYQRNVFHIANDDDDQILPPCGGDYYSYNTFLRRARYKDLSETGEIYMACVKGSNLYYQGIPSVSENLLVYFYRLPVAMATTTSTPDGIPSAFSLDIYKHWVLADYFGDMIGNDLKADIKYPDKAYSKYKFHMGKFYEVMENMIQFIGDHDAEPFHYHSDSDYTED